MAEVGAQLDAANKERDQLWAKWRRLEAKKIAADYARTVGGTLSPHSVMALNWEEIGNGNAMGIYDEVTKYLYTWSEKGVYHAGGHWESGQIAVSIMLDQNKPLKDQQGIREWAPHLKLADGVGWIDIFESSLSEHGVYQLRKEKGKLILEKTIYGRREDLKEFRTMPQALEYIYKHHPYQWAGEED